MCNGHNHSAWCTCGWGGEGHRGRQNGTSAHGNLIYQVWERNESFYSLANLRSLWSIGQPRSALKTPLTHPTYCHFCGALIFFHTNGNGDCVFFDELGPPWPKHWCLQSEDNIRKAANSDELMKLAGLIVPPSHISRPKEAALRKFALASLGEIVTGAVLSTKMMKVWRSLPGKAARKPVTVWKTMLLITPTKSLHLYTNLECRLKIGQIIKVKLSKDMLGGANVFFAESYQIEKPPQEDEKTDGVT